MQHHAFAHVEADIEAPFFPLDVVAAGHREAGALGLGDGDGLLGGAQRAGEFGVGVVSVFGRNREDSGVDHLGDFLVDHVDVGHQTVHRVGPGAVAREVLHEREPAENPAAPLLRVLEHTGGQRGHTHLADIQVTGGQCLQPPPVPCQQRLHHLELLFEDRQFARGCGVELDGGNNSAAGDGHGDVVGTGAGNVVDEDPEAALHRAGGCGIAGGCPVGARAADGADAGRIHQSEVGDALLGAEEPFPVKNVLHL